MKRSPHMVLGITSLSTNRRIRARLSISTLAFLLTLQPPAALAESAPSFEVDLKAALAGYRASKRTYKPVTNKKSDVVGILEDIILGDGKANFALIDVGSFSLGPHMVVVPFDRFPPIDRSWRVRYI